jgi:ketosteroid isomerase-like protein
MRRLGLGLMLALGLLAGPALAADVSKEVTEAAKQWDAAFNKQDAKTLAGFYAKDATLLPPANTVVTGSDKIEAFWKSLFDGGWKQHAIEVTDYEAKGDMAYRIGNWSASGPDGKTYHGRLMTVLERAGGAWKTKAHTWNMIE